MSNSINPNKFKNLVSELSSTSGYEHMLLLATDGEKEVIVGKGSNEDIKVLVIDAFLSIVLGINLSEDVKEEDVIKAKERAMMEAFDNFVSDLHH